MTTYTLQILHASDISSGSTNLQDGVNFTALVDLFEDQYANSITLATGDNFLPGPVFYAGEDFNLQEYFTYIYTLLTGQELTGLGLGGGRVDITLMNIIGFDASGIGNHEFDLGTSTLANLIGADVRGNNDSDIRWLGAQFPYLAANLDFSGDSRLNPLFTAQILPNTAFQATPDQLLDNFSNGIQLPKIAPATIIEEGGEQIGVLSVTNPFLREITQVGGVQVIGGEIETATALAAVLQPTINSLISQGVNKIILMTDLSTFALDQALANQLTGIDVILSGSGEALQADDNDNLRQGDIPTDTYPILTHDAANNPTLIVSTNGQFNYLGRLLVDFDENGVILTDNLDSTVNGIYATTDETVAAAWGEVDPFGEGTKGSLAQILLLGGVQGLIDLKDGNVYGYTNVLLNGNSNDLRTQETNLGNLLADANLAAARQVDATTAVMIQNAGGVRGSFATGEISQLDTETNLRFNNQLVLYTVSATELKTLLENGVSQSGNGLTSARFPLISGLRFSFDTTDENGNPIPQGQRIQNAVFTNAQGNITDILVQNGVVVGDPNRSIRVATFEFLANGGDGYAFPTFGENRVNTGTTEQKAFENYVRANFTASNPYQLADTSSSEDTRIQNLDFRSDEIIPNNPIITVNETFTRTQNQTLTFTDSTLLGNDLHLNNLPLTLTGVQSAVNGTVSFSNGVVSFTPNSGFTGIANFQYSVTDGLQTNTGTVELNITPFIGNNAKDTLKGTNFDDILIGGQGKDILTGLGGSDRFVYTDITDGGDTITDFQPGFDKIDLSGVFESLGLDSSNPLGSQYIRLIGRGNNTLLQLDPDGSGAITPKSFLTVLGITPSVLAQSENFVF